jgi:hypothetical protein
VLSQGDVSPVLVHLGGEEILVNGRQFGTESDAQVFEDLVISTRSVIIPVKYGFAGNVRMGFGREFGQSEQGGPVRMEPPLQRGFRSNFQDDSDK